MSNRVQFPKKLEQLFKTKKKYIPISGGRSSGKSRGAGGKIVLDTAQGHRCLCFREIQNSIAESSYQLIGDTIERMKIPGFKDKQNEFSHASSGKIVFKGLKGGSKQVEKTRIKSLEGFTRGWGEEASGISQEHLDIIMPTFREKGCQVIFTYNRFFESEAVHDTLVLQNRPDVEHISINYYENKFCPIDIKNEADRLKKNNYELWLHIYGGEPINQADNSIISRSALQKAINREISDDGGIAVGADIARFGDDRIVFFKRKGMKIIDWKEYNKKKITETASLLMEFIGGKDIICNVDDSGLGGGVTDILEDNGYNVVPVNFGEKPKDYDKYPNAISEMWFEFSDTINEVSLPDIRDMKAELTSRLYNYDNKQKRIVESKKEYKSRMHRSPDYADALLLCFYISGNQIPDMSNEKILTKTRNNETY